MKRVSIWPKKMVFCISIEKMLVELLPIQPHARFHSLSTMWDLQGTKGVQRALKTCARTAPPQPDVWNKRGLSNTGPSSPNLWASQSSILLTTLSISKLVRFQQLPLLAWDRCILTFTQSLWPILGAFFLIVGSMLFPIFQTSYHPCRHRWLTHGLLFLLVLTQNSL